MFRKNSKIIEETLGIFKKSIYISNMKREIYIEGIGWCIERTIYRVNENGINEPYTMYEPLNK